MSNNVNYVKCVVYDLPSENIKQLGSEGVKKKVRSVRVTSTYILHSLGVGCTESVILVPSERASDIPRAIEKVMRAYEELSREIGLPLRPLIQVLDLTREQYEALRPIAERRLVSALDEAIDRVSEILEEIATITESERLRSIRSSLTRLRRNWSQLFQYARELGIDISRDYEYLVNLIDQALRGTE